MRAFFGVVALLVVLAIVGQVAKKQLQALRLTAPPVAAASAPGDRAGRFDAFSGAVAADPNMTVPQQSQAIQQSVRESVVNALEKGEKRSEKEQP